MKFNYSSVSLCVTVFIAITIISINGASLEETSPLLNAIRNKRGLKMSSPWLRLDELSHRIYIAKHKLGAGLIDPLDIGKRSTSAESTTSTKSESHYPEIGLALSIFEGLQSCKSYDLCSKALELLMKNLDA